MSGQIWITGTIFHISFLNRAPSRLPFRKAPLVRLEINRIDFFFEKWNIQALN